MVNYKAALNDILKASRNLVRAEETRFFIHGGVLPFTSKALADVLDYTETPLNDTELDKLKEIYLQVRELSNKELSEKVGLLELPIDEQSRKSILYSDDLSQICFEYSSRDIESPLVSKFLDLVFQLELENQVPNYYVRAVLNIMDPIVFSRMTLTLATYKRAIS